MMPLILLAAIAGVPVVLALVFRVSAVFLFLSIVVGDLLVKYLSYDAGLVLNSFIKGPTGPMITQLALLFLPVVFTLLILRKSMPTSKLILHILPLALTGLSIVVFTLPLLTSGTQSQVFATPIGNTLRQSQSLVVSATAIIVLLLTWFSHRPHHDKKHGKRH